MKEYLPLKMEVIAFETEDVIVTSGGAGHDSSGDEGDDDN